MIDAAETVTMNPGQENRPEASTPSEPTSWLSPLFYWELRRESRKGNSYLPRVVYAGGLLVVLYLVMGSTEITQTRISQLCDEAFRYYIVMQYMAVILLTPAYVVGTIIEDRQQRTLSLLLTTHLTPREIVVGKMMGRLVPMLDVLLAGVPVLAILQLLGGISMEWLAFHTIMALMILFTAGMHAIRSSATCKTVGGALMQTYGHLLVFAFLGLPFGLLFLGSGNPIGLIVGAVVVVGFYLFIAWISLYQAIAVIGKRDRDQDWTLSEHERWERLVPLEVEGHQAEGAKQSQHSNEGGENLSSQRQRSELTRKLAKLESWPILWKEIVFPSPDMVLIFTILFCGFPLLIFVLNHINFRKPIVDSDMQPFLVGCAHALLSLVLLLTALRAAGTMILERKKQTLVSVLTTPLSWSRVIVEFWLGSFWRYRWMALGTLLIAICASLLQPMNLLILVPVYLTQLGFFSMLGVACSMVFQSTFQARVIISVYFFLSYLVFPWIKIPSIISYVWFLDFLLFPYYSWPMSPVEDLPKDWIAAHRFAIQSPLLLSVIYFINLAIAWGLIYLLFVFSRRRLKSWLERGLG